MLELVNDLVEGEKYYVVQYRRAVVEGDLIYIGDSFFKYPNGTNSFQVHERFYDFYRYVSKDEYYMKLKEKYNQKCLDIVLKRLVDESFQW
jgi:hypothetical protein